jgi:hypothetical protein
MTTSTQPESHTFAEPALTFPIRLYAQRDQPLSRWLWLVKWVLLIPHGIVLAALWVAFAVLTVVAWIAVLITARYPRPIFDFNIGDACSEASVSAVAGLTGSASVVA